MASILLMHVPPKMKVMKHQQVIVKAVWVHSRYHITNKAAIQSLHSILTGESFPHYQSPQDAIQQSIAIFHQIEDTKTHSTVNVLMKLFLHFNEPQHVFPLWNVLISTPDLSYPLLVKCCVDCNPPHFSMDKCIESLSRMQAMNYRVSKSQRSAHSKTVSKLIRYRCTEYKHLQSIQTVTYYNSDIFNKNALIGAFGKFKDTPHSTKGLQSAVTIFHSIPMADRTTVTINAMMTVYINHSYFTEGLNLYDEYYDVIRRDEIHSMISHKLAIRACIGLNDVSKGRSIADSVRHHNHPELQCSLISFYGHCRDLKAAENVFNSVSEDNRTVIHVGAMMKALIATKRFNRALALYDANERITNDVTHLLTMKVCQSLHDYDKGRAVHQQIIKRMKKSRGQRMSVELVNALIDFYGYFKKFGEIQKLLDSLSAQTHASPRLQKAADLDPSTVNSVMTVFIDHDRFREALDFYNSVLDNTESMNGQKTSECQSHNELSHTLAIKACRKCGDFAAGKAIHQRLSRYIPDGSMSMKLRNTLIHFYGRFGDILAAQRMFESQQDAVSLNNMMRGYMDIGQHRNALDLYDEFVAIGMVDDVSHLFAVMACGALKEYQRGKEIHSRLDAVDRTQCGNALIDFYGNFGDIDAAEEIFNSFGTKVTAVSVNSMMKCYVDYGAADKALKLYDEYESLRDVISHTLALKACSKSNRLQKGHSICDWLKSHNKEMRYFDDVMVKITMIDFYGNCGDIDTALLLFEGIAPDQRDTVCFNAMMEAYFVNERYTECMEMFEEMRQCQGTKLDTISYSIALKVATQSMSVNFGERVHGELLEMDSNNNGSILRQREVQSNLITMYGAFGKLRECEGIFEGIKDNEYDKYCSDLDIWNAMIGAYSANGDIVRVQRSLRKMESLGMTLNEKIYVSLINMYSHRGEVESAEKIWKINIVDDKVRYNKFVTTAMVDSLARSGRLKDTLGIVMEYERYSGNDYHDSMWSACLSGCYQHCNAENALLAREIFQEMCLRFDDDSIRMKSASIVMTNISAAQCPLDVQSKCAKMH